MRSWGKAARVQQGERTNGRPLRLRCCVLAGAITVALLTSFAPRPVTAGCPCSGELEIVFVIDCTSSMKELIGTVKAQAAKIIHVLTTNLQGVRVGLVAYRTDAIGDDVFMRRHSFDLTSDRDRILKKIDELRASGGGIEACAEGLARAVNEMSWTKGARKVVVLIGDEGPDPAKEDDMYALARDAARRGIVIYTITVSESAYYYYKNLHPEEVARMERLHGQETVRANFRHPVFVQTAELTRGRAVGSNTVRDLVKWLLAFGLEAAAGEGVVNERMVDDLIAWEGPEDDADAETEPEGQVAGAGTPLFARLQHAGGWKVPHSDRKMLASLNKQIAIGGQLKMARLTLDDESLNAYGLLYISGQGDPRFTTEDRARLRTYVESGGMLLVDPGCEGAAFLAAMRRELSAIFGPEALQPLSLEHPVFHQLYEVEQVRRCQPRRSTTYVDAPPRLEGIEVNGRLGVVFSPDNLGCGWQQIKFGLPCDLHDEDALKLTLNILVLALQ